MTHSITPRPASRLRLGIILLLALVVGGIVFSGCGQQAPGLVNPKPLGNELAAIEALTPVELTTLIATLDQDIEKVAASGDTKALKSNENLMHLRIKQGYAYEVGKTRNELTIPTYLKAQELYQSVADSSTPYADQARYRLGVLGANGKLIPAATSRNDSKKSFSALRMKMNANVLVRMPELAGQGGNAEFVASKPVNTPASSVMFPEKASQAAIEKLDVLYQTSGGLDAIKYNTMDVLVTFFKRLSPGYGAALALIALALIVKIVTIPFTNASFKGMRDMQRIQPLLKELQEKFKDDKQKLAEEQMKLMKAHKVSMGSGCVPLLIQMPIIYVIYQAVMVYSFKFSDSQFLWIGSSLSQQFSWIGANLSSPDMPLLILYGISMIVTQKLTATPTADPQQQMMQKQMTIMMPLFFVVFLNTIASAFVLYWFFLNLFSAVHQYILVQKANRDEAAAGITFPAVSNSSSATPSPEARRKKRK